jgi:hypothetical protein
MKSLTFIAAVAVFAAGSAFAAPAPVAAAGAVAAANSSITATHLNVPVVTIGNPQARTRAEVRAEASEALHTQKTALAIQLDLAKN